MACTVFDMLGQQAWILQEWWRQRILSLSPQKCQFEEYYRNEDLRRKQMVDGRNSESPEGLTFRRITIVQFLFPTVQPRLNHTSFSSLMRLDMRSQKFDSVGESSGSDGFTIFAKGVAVDYERGCWKVLEEHYLLCLSCWLLVFFGRNNNYSEIIRRWLLFLLFGCVRVWLVCL